MAAQSGVIRKKGNKYYIFDASSGRELLLKGYGAQRIKLDVDPRIDLTGPIFEQAANLRRSRKAGAVKSLAAADGMASLLLDTRTLLWYDSQRSISVDAL